MPTVVSSSGKVLLAGGYLVLDPAYSGVVVSTSSRFYTVISSEEGTTNGTRPVQIRVQSPQFVNATWVYALSIEQGRVRLEQLADDTTSNSKNKFVQLALEQTIAYALQVNGEQALRNQLTDLTITILGDNDFYSQRAQLESRNLPPTLASLQHLPPFLPTGVLISEVHKTGLGSSAALITSLTSALLLHLGVIPSSSFDSESGSASEGRKLAHNLGQFVHCLAQGKVGSGFDVSAAVFGSQIYTRFDPAVIQPLMSDNVVPSVLADIISSSNPAWSYRVEPFQLPPSVRMMLADVDAGSDTPSLVGKVLSWRKANPVEAKTLWDSLDKLNQHFAQTLLLLSKLGAEQPEPYKKVIKYLSSLQSPQWLAHPVLSSEDRTIIEPFDEVRKASEGIRSKMREMGEKSGVPIEPPEQTALLNACTSVAGVIGGGVPGAGGYDAIWLLVFDPSDCPQDELPSTRVEGVWSSWKGKGLDVSPLLASESVVKGVRVESFEAVKGLKEAVEAGV